ncbi:MAG: glycosyltransferase [Desulfomonile sp.]|nr:glycosyltransferase [Desulfomonile sp.]
MKHVEGPLVSVIIPSYNHEVYVRQALESVLTSSVKDIEVIVVDDGSTDRSIEEIQQAADSRVRLIRQENHGAHAALNCGVNAASAPWVAILNSDDRFHPRKLERHLDFHEHNSVFEASASRVRYVASNGVPLHTPSPRLKRYRRAVTAAQQADSLFASFLAGNHLVTTSCLFVSRDTLNEIGGFPPLRYVHDWFVFLALALRGRFVVIEEELADYRRHPTNTISENDAMGRVEDNFVLEWHLTQAFAARRPIMDIEEALRILGRNRRVSYRLLLLFRLWRELNDNDLNRAASIFMSPDHPFMRSARGIVAAEESGLRPDRLLRRFFGRRVALAADWLDRGLSYAAKLALAGRERSEVE